MLECRHEGGRIPFPPLLLPMTPDQRSLLEARIAHLLAVEDFSLAAEAVLRGYGPEILGWLRGTTRTPQDADDAFSRFSGDVWDGISRFRGASSARTWAYTLARHAHHRLLRDPYRKRAVHLTDSPASLIEQDVRASTVPYLKTAIKDGFALLREELDPEDRELLVLRVDRDMAWTDIALVMTSGEPPSPEALRRRSASLRKRFERVKERLKQRALEEGLLGKDAG